MSSATGQRQVRAFIDTNFLVHAADDTEPEKQTTTRELIAAPGPVKVVSTKVLLEFFHSLTRIFGKPHTACREIVGMFAHARVVSTDTKLVFQAIDTSILNQISVWDAMIVDAAGFSSCGVLYSEDLTHGQMIRGVRVINPFKTSSAAR